jgi:eukaryotic-like serine/threonine-protein kinase
MISTEVIAQAEKRVGQTVGGKWRLDRVIGVGGMAAVYEATHRNRLRVALKLLHPILSLDEGTRHRFLREGYVANTIRHEGAVQVLDDDLTGDGIAFLVMELLEGETVEDRMDRKGGVLEIAEALHITEDLLDVLCAAHDQGVIHRDIKPDNLFLTDDGRLKVLDFGIARLHQGDSRATKVGSFMGTPAYCAPEQARGRWDEVDARTDLFSVAATLFTMLTGSHVHPAETSSEQLALAIGATARSLREAFPHAPDELVECVDRALSYDKDDRFQSARAMKAELQKVRAGIKDIKTLPPPGPPSVRPRAPRALSYGTEYTLTGDETEKDHNGYAGLYRVKPPARVLIGLLAAGVLATFILIVAQTNHQHSSQEAAQQVTIRTQVPPAPISSGQPGAAAATSPPILPEQSGIRSPAREPIGAPDAGEPSATALTAPSAVKSAPVLPHPPGSAADTSGASAAGPSAASAGAQRAPTPSASYPHPSATESGKGRASGTVTEDSIFGSRF